MCVFSYLEAWSGTVAMLTIPINVLHNPYMQGDFGKELREGLINLWESMSETHPLLQERREDFIHDMRLDPDATIKEIMETIMSPCVLSGRPGSPWLALAGCGSMWFDWAPWLALAGSISLPWAPWLALAGSIHRGLTSLI